MSIFFRYLHMPGVITSEQELTAKLGASPFTCVHFAADWCPPCKDLNTALDELAPEFPGVAFVTVDAEKLAETAEKHGVESVPAVVFFKAATSVKVVLGAKVPDIRDALRDLTAVAPNAALPLEERLKALVNRASVIIFIKGTATSPACGFSKQAIELLNSTKVPYDYFNILTDPEVREGLKKFSNWPTYPQLYVKGELVGGVDVMKELQASNEFASTLKGE